MRKYTSNCNTNFQQSQENFHPADSQNKPLKSDKSEGESLIASKAQIQGDSLMSALVSDFLSYEKQMVTVIPKSENKKSKGKINKTKTQKALFEDIPK